MGRGLVEGTDITGKVAEYLGLEYKQPNEEGDGEGGGDGFGDFGGFGEESGAAETPGDGDVPAALSDEAADSMADAVTESLPEGATDADIAQAVETVSAEA